MRLLRRMVRSRFSRKVGCEMFYRRRRRRARQEYIPVPVGPAYEEARVSPFWQRVGAFVAMVGLLVGSVAVVVVSQQLTAQSLALLAGLGTGVCVFSLALSPVVLLVLAYLRHQQAERDRERERARAERLQQPSAPVVVVGGGGVPQLAAAQPVGYGAFSPEYTEAPRRWTQVVDGEVLDGAA